MSDQLKQQLALYQQSRADRKVDLSRYTHARVGLGHTGGHWLSQDWLSFQSGFAQAKDAVFSHYPLADMQQLCEQQQLPCFEIQSQATDVPSFLLRPDAGRHLSAQDEALLLEAPQKTSSPDLLLVISGGLSPIAIAQQMPIFLPLFIQQVRAKNWTLAPVMLNPRGRVALGDALNHFCHAKIVMVCIGERPGLTTPDSMGIYFTYGAKPGCTDEQRNCISNIHQRGLSPQQAVNKLIYLLGAAMRNRLSGIGLKDDFISAAYDPAKE